MNLATSNPLKRINIINKETGGLMRTTRAQAVELVNAGTHHTTSKNKLKSFLNKLKKSYANEYYFKSHKIDLNNKSQANLLRRDDGRIYAEVKEHMSPDKKYAGMHLRIVRFED